MNNVLRIILIVVGVFVGISFLVMGGGLFALAGAVSSDGGDDKESSGSITGPRVALVEVKDVIMTSEDIVRQLKKYDKNKNVKAIVVRVESPGGSVAPSQEIYEAMRNIREAGKPIVVSMGDMAASGGYYISIGGTKIFSNPGTLTGSIGVILQYPNYMGLMDKVGVQYNTVKSGKMKDVGSPFRKSTDEETKYLQDLIDNTYNQFVGAVSHERGIPMDELKEIADGRVLTGWQAYEYGLVDTIGSYDDAIKYAAMLGGIEGEPKTVKEKKKQTFVELLNSQIADNPLNRAYDMFGTPRLQYKLVFD